MYEFKGRHECFKVSWHFVLQILGRKMSRLEFLSGNIALNLNTIIKFELYFMIINKENLSKEGEDHFSVLMTLQSI